MGIYVVGKQSSINLVFSSENLDESSVCCLQKNKNPHSCKNFGILFRIIRQNHKKYSPQSNTEDKLPSSPFCSSGYAISDGRKIIDWDISVGGELVYSPDNRTMQADLQVCPSNSRNDKTIQPC
jgi:hypothetical protein